MKLSEINNLKTGDILYSFRDKEFYVYEVNNVQNFPAVHEILVTIVAVNNVPEVKQRFHIISIPFDASYVDENPYKYNYEFSLMDKDLNTAFQNYSELINREIRKLNGTRANLKGLKRQYMLSKNMEDNDIPDWKRYGYKSAEAYNEYLAELGDDFRHGYIE